MVDVLVNFFLPFFSDLVLCRHVSSSNPISTVFGLSCRCGAFSTYIFQRVLVILCILLCGLPYGVCRLRDWAPRPILILYCLECGAYTPPVAYIWCSRFCYFLWVHACRTGYGWLWIDICGCVIENLCSIWAVWSFSTDGACCNQRCWHFMLIPCSRIAVISNADTSCSQKCGNPDAGSACSQIAVI